MSSSLSYKRRGIISFFMLALLICGQCVMTGCHESKREPGEEQTEVQEGPTAPMFSTEIRSLPADKLNELGAKNALPTEYVYPGAYYIQSIDAKALRATEGGEDALTYFATTSLQLPDPKLLVNADMALYSKGMAPVQLLDAKTSSVLQENFPLDAEVVYIVCETPVDQKSVVEEIFKDVDASKVKEASFGSLTFTVNEDSLLLPLDESGQLLGKVEHCMGGVCCPTSNSILFMSGPSSAFEQFASELTGDQRGVAAQRIARIDMTNVAMAFQFDYDAEFPNVLQIRPPFPVTQDLHEAMSKNVEAFQFLVDISKTDSNLITLNVNTKTKEGVDAMRKAISGMIMQTLDSLETAQKNVPENADANGLSDLNLIIAMLKSVRFDPQDQTLTGVIQNSEERLGFFKKTFQTINDVRQNSEIESKYAALSGALAQINNAFKRYVSANKTYPHAICDANGAPLLSWRVALLPTFGGQFEELYKQFKLDEPWNSDTNIKLLDKMPAIYRSSADPALMNKTQFQVFTSPETPFGRYPDGLKLQNLEDPAATIAIACVSEENAIEWTKPEALTFNPEKPTATFGDRVLAVTFLDNLLNLPCDDSEELAKRLATFIYGVAPEDDAQEASPSNEAPADDAGDAVSSEEVPAEEKVDTEPVAEPVADATTEEESEGTQE